MRILREVTDDTDANVELIDGEWPVVTVERRIEHEQRIFNKGVEVGKPPRYHGGIPRESHGARQRFSECFRTWELAVIDRGGQPYQPVDIRPRRGIVRGGPSLAGPRPGWRTGGRGPASFQEAGQEGYIAAPRGT